MEPTKCVKCGHEMESGFVLDTMEYGVDLQYWHPGPLEHGWLGGIKVDYSDPQRCPVTTLRCAACGYLEFYAPPRNRGV